jgi:hypothetical protein
MHLPGTHLKVRKQVHVTGVLKTNSLSFKPDGDAVTWHRIVQRRTIYALAAAVLALIQSLLVHAIPCHNMHATCKLIFKVYLDKHTTVIQENS